MINSLYVHVPFCIKKCLYCDFNSYSGLENLQDAYIESLIKEIENIKCKNFKTIFIGGGTPTILSIKNLDRLLKTLSKFNPEEFTIEGNPGTITNEKIKIIKNYGVNRFSIGLQAWQDSLLKKLGRIHNIDDFLKSYQLIKNNGINNINVDLMFAIPNQNINDWMETLTNVVELKPKHLSCYSLIIEEDTPFYKMYNDGTLKKTEEETEMEMYYSCVDFLNSKGFERYEISNFALKNFECKHNITYWKDEEYIGVGCGAHSYVAKNRYNNKKNIEDYIKSENKRENESILELKDEISEYMFLGLRMMEGIDKAKFKQRFNMEICEVYNNELNELIKMKLIEDNSTSVFLTNRGIDISNQVFIKFLK